MQHRKLNLVAAFVVALGAFLLGKPSTAVAGSCTGPAGAQGCTCTSGDGKYTCTGDTCTSDATSCSYKDILPT